MSKIRIAGKAALWKKVIISHQSYTQNLEEKKKNLYANMLSRLLMGRSQKIAFAFSFSIYLYKVR